MKGNTDTVEELRLGTNYFDSKHNPLFTTFVYLMTTYFGVCPNLLKKET